jgi:hypothetical protein
MKSITEFASFTLSKGLKSRETLLAEGKTPEEVQAALGTSFKFEGEKLTYFLKALDVAKDNAANLKRIIILGLNEGEALPAKAVSIDNVHLLPEFLVTSPTSFEQSEKKIKNGKRGGRKPKN